MVLGFTQLQTEKVPEDNSGGKVQPEHKDDKLIAIYEPIF
jgi:hypothetical protein